MKNLSHFDEKSQLFWSSQVGRYEIYKVKPCLRRPTCRVMYVPTIQNIYPCLLNHLVHSKQGNVLCPVCIIICYE